MANKQTDIFRNDIKIRIVTVVNVNDIDSFDCLFFSPSCHAHSNETLFCYSQMILIFVYFITSRRLSRKNAALTWFLLRMFGITTGFTGIEKIIKKMNERQ